MSEQLPGKMTMLGLMSGTSLDGLDLALCEFGFSENGYAFKILQSSTSEYDTSWKDRLQNAKNLSAEKYFELHGLYGNYISQEVNKFLKKSHLKRSSMAIASHGHTVFHQPQKGFSTQIGCGATIAAKTGITTVCDFRSLDVAHGGQGAPLVPIGDKLLFNNYQACLNIGGIANISFDDTNGNRLAYDICEANMLLNYLTEKTGKPFDKNGEIAKAGKINTGLLNELNSIGYYEQTGAKSIGREWFEKNILNLVDSQHLDTRDSLATATEHVAQIIVHELQTKKIKNVLVSGGGAFNTYLIEKIKSKTACDIIIPENEIVGFKESLIFAFLGYLRLKGSSNTLKSVTGATKDSIGGAVYLV